MREMSWPVHSFYVHFLKLVVLHVCSVKTSIIVHKNVLFFYCFTIRKKSKSGYFNGINDFVTFPVKLVSGRKMNLDS